MIKVKVIDSKPNEQGQSKIDLFNNSFGEDGYPLDKETGWTKTQMNELGSQYVPIELDLKVVGGQLILGDEDMDFQEVTLTFLKRDFLKIENNKESKPLLFLKDNSYYELKNSKQVKIIESKLSLPWYKFWKRG